MAQFPIASDAYNVGQVAVTLSQAIFEKNGWIFRRGDGSTDFGIDAEAEIRDANLVTGKILKCQIKGTKKLEWNHDATRISVKVSTHNYWKALGLPVILLLVDVQTEDVYWCVPWISEPRPEAGTVSIPFLQERNLKERFEEVRSFVESWHSSFSGQDTLREVPYFHHWYQQLKQLVDWGDSWMPIDGELDFQVRLFYAHVLRLRLGVGLLNGLIFPLDFWYIRNQGLSDDWPITHSVFSELVQFIIPFYEEALAVVIERLRNATPNFENQELVNFVRTLDGKTGFVGVIDPRAEDEAFHRKMEETLAERNCLRTHTTIQHGKEVS